MEIEGKGKTYTKDGTLIFSECLKDEKNDMVLPNM